MSKKYRMTTDIPESVTLPDKMDTSIGTLEFLDGAPLPETAEKVYDYLDRMRAVNTFLKGMPGASLQSLYRTVLNEAKKQSHNHAAKRAEEHQFSC